MAASAAGKRRLPGTCFWLFAGVAGHFRRECASNSASRNHNVFCADWVLALDPRTLR